MAHYQIYFQNQIGQGNAVSSGIGKVFAGSYQKVHGIGSFFSSLHRYVMPLVKSGIKTLGKKAVKGGLNVLSDVARDNAPVRQSIRRRAHESLENLKRGADAKLDSLMEGSGYKKRRLYGLSSQVFNPTSGADVVVTKRKRKRRRPLAGKKKSRKRQKKRRKVTGGVRKKKINR